MEGERMNNWKEQKARSIVKAWKAGKIGNSKTNKRAYDAAALYLTT